MKRVKRFFNWLQQAEKFQNRLYGKYNSVKLVGFPQIDKAGFYVWEVSDRISVFKCKNKRK
jgi:hypothetical protein